MAHSYVDFHNNNFRVHDLDLAVTCFLIIDQAKAIASTKLQPMFNHWVESISSYGPGCIDLHLDHNLNEPESAEILINLLDLVARDLDSYPDTYPKDKLDGSLRKAKINLENDYKIELIRNVINELRTLIKLGSQRYKDQRG